MELIFYAKNNTQISGFSLVKKLQVLKKKFV